MKTLVVTCLFACAFLVACTPEGGRKTKNPQELYGYRMSFPEEGQWCVSGRDTSVVLTDRPRIVAYYGAQGCTSCRLKELAQWKELMKQAERQTDMPEVEWVFILKTDPGSDELRLSLDAMRFDHPVWCDPRGEFEKNNLLPEQEFLQAFLLDRDNRVLLVGTPIFNPALWENYLRLIRVHTLPSDGV